LLTEWTICKSLSQLDRYRWSGHSVLLSKIENDWQDRGYVLKWFGKTEGKAKDAYRNYVKKAILQTGISVVPDIHNIRIHISIRDSNIPKLATPCWI